jgi:hypothetical protein
MFQDALREIVDRTEGGVASLIMDSEGIAVESYARDDAPFDITTIGIEFGVVLGSINGPRNRSRQARLGKSRSARRR